MPKKFIQRFLPDHQTIKNQKSLKIFGNLLHDPNLWHLNRHSVTTAFALGLFNAFIPVPFQMWLSAAGAIIFRANLPLSVAIVWITNPFTIPPIFYACYLLGSFVLGQEQQNFQFELSWQFLTESMATIGPALLTGCGIAAVTFSLLGYIGISLIWRMSVANNWKKRQISREPK
ncbi:DUF2062 domain-containing protein [Catenovulum maritimum]|uniref:Flagellar biosynthesis protein FlhF n=1 Tax=Catenovulum maritimum TaxID=1513271 RepID=A0A0J8JHD3_9ALTE|nr:DUF2062 domain-containing protein [Catenovulum maritimum]KMT63836.1 flagellar biosynthesis protein FlhF [Catenovulum maritimum]